MAGSLEGLPSPPKVFISYSHDSPAHQDRILALANRLRAEGIDAILDQYVSAPAEGWPLWMERQVRVADFVLLICTPEYERRVEGDIQSGKGLGVLWEGNLIRNELYTSLTTNRKFIPILLDNDDLSSVPLPLRGVAYYRVSTEDGWDNLYRYLTNQPKALTPCLGRLHQLPSLTPKSFPATVSQSTYIAPAFFGKGLEQRQRAQMLQRVRNDWIDGVLDQSLYKVARIELHLEDVSQVVERPWHVEGRVLDEEPRELSPGNSMAMIFEQFGGALLILGAPGSGKTTVLLELARDLLAKAQQDESYPIPTVFNLSSWATRRTSIAEWLIDELTERYFVPPKTSRVWIEGEYILPLLDGLDEVSPEHRNSCVEAINAFRRQHGMVPIAICSRTTDYQNLATRLRVPGAVLIGPLQQSEIHAYLEDVGPRLCALRSALDQDPELSGLFDTPLMLTVGMLAYSGSVAADEPKTATETRREALFARYVSRMIERRSGDHQYSRDQITAWLGWLAASMTFRAQTVFHLEDLQPEWLQPVPAPWRIAAAIGLGVAIPFYTQFLILLPLNFIAMTKMDEVNPFFSMRLHPLLTVAQNLFFITMVYGGGGAFIYWFGRKQGWRVHPVETLRISIASIRASLRNRRDLVRKGRRWGFRIGTGYAVLGLVIAFVLIARYPASHRTPPLVKIGGILLYALVATLLYGLIGWLAGWVTTSMFAVIADVGGEVDVHVRPNEGTFRSLRTGVIVWVAISIVGIAASFLFAGSAPPSWRNLVIFEVTSLVMTIGGIVGLVLGGFFSIHHYMLRVFLRWRRCIPYKYVKFLDYATECILLRRVGSGYIFIHRTLLEFFAKRYGDASQASVENTQRNGSKDALHPARNQI